MLPKQHSEPRAVHDHDAGLHVVRGPGHVRLPHVRQLDGHAREEVKEEPVRYGLTNNIDTYRPTSIAFGEYATIIKDLKRTQRWQDGLRYLLLAPGWDHEGEDKRSNTLRKAHH